MRTKYIDPKLWYTYVKSNGTGAFGAVSEEATSVIYSDEKWEELFHPLLAYDSIQRVVNSAAKLIGNPIMVFDSNYHTVICSSVHHEQDEFWLSGISRGYMTYEYIGLLDTLVPRRESQNECSYAVTSLVGPLRRIIGRLVIDYVQIGYFAILEFDNRFENVQEKDYQLILKCLAKALHVECAIKLSDNRLPCENIILNLLNRGIPNTQMLRARIRGTQLDRNTTFVIISVDMGQYLVSDFMEANFKKSIHELLPEAWSVYYQQYIIIVVDAGHKLYKEIPLLERLNDLIKNTKFTAGVSDPFSDLCDILIFCHQANRTHQLAMLIKEKQKIFLYDNFKLHDMVTTLAKDHAAKHYCSKIVMHIKQFDDENGTEYLKTLFYYLQSAKSPSRASLLLHVHRNTVIYRIERIMEIFAVDFSNEEENMLNYISCLFFLYNLA